MFSGGKDRAAGMTFCTIKKRGKIEYKNFYSPSTWLISFIRLCWKDLLDIIRVLVPYYLQLFFK